MKQPLLFLAALVASVSGMAQDVGRVFFSTPVLEQVAVQQSMSGAGRRPPWWA